MSDGTPVHIGWERVSSLLAVPLPKITSDWGVHAEISPPQFFCPIGPLRYVPRDGMES